MGLLRPGVGNPRSGPGSQRKTCSVPPWEEGPPGPLILLTARWSQQAQRPAQEVWREEEKQVTFRREVRSRSPPGPCLFPLSRTMSSWFSFVTYKAGAGAPLAAQRASPRRPPMVSSLSHHPTKLRSQQLPPQGDNSRRISMPKSL